MPQVYILPEAKGRLRQEMFFYDPKKNKGLEDTALQLSCYEIAMILIFDKYGSFR